MKENARFYECPICGNIVGLIDGDISHITCCGKAMEEMIANTTDAAVEKHVPVYERVEDEIVVKVGEVEHPMEKEQATETRFPYIPGATLYAYCNKHGLWKTTVE